MGKWSALFLSAAISISLCSSVIAQQPAQVRYQSHYQLLGFLLRSFSVCPGATKKSIDAAFNLVSGPEYMALSKAYRETTQNWMTEGAGIFNDTVMRDGVPSACKRARQALIRAKRM